MSNTSALFNFFVRVGKATAGGLAASKPVEKGCGTCPKTGLPLGPMPSRRGGRVRRANPRRRSG